MGSFSVTLAFSGFILVFVTGAWMLLLGRLVSGMMLVGWVSALAQSAPAGSGAAEANTSRLEALAVRFEADHPSLAATLRRLVDLLSEVGI